MKNVTPEIVEEILTALTNIRGWGSVEIQIQDHKIVQITERNIRKTNGTNSVAHNVKISS